ncbi:MAG: hypothetical protein GY757_06695 [bacterium]|nr:hypothetical protein [bacterium]
MSKIRVIFLLVAFIIMATCIFFFNAIQAPLEPEINTISELKITKISGKGHIYSQGSPIGEKQLAAADYVNIKNMVYGDEIYLRNDKHTAFEFYCLGIRFSALPGTYLYYHPKTKELLFYSGELLWNKESKGKSSELIIKSEAPRAAGSRQGSLTLSESGKLKATGNWLKIWSYNGIAKYNDGTDDFNLKSNNYLIAFSNRKARTYKLLSAPKIIAPDNKTIAISETGDSVVHFNWKRVKGATNYVFRLYSSQLMENILFQKEIDTNKLVLDLLQFDDIGNFYWQVFPYSPYANSEGTPSKMGSVKMIGALLNKENALKPPELDIKNFTINGNLVLIEGQTNKNAQLFINDTLVPLNMDGTFFHTMNFKEIGQHQIIYKVVSASGIEALTEKVITIYD